jgi:hypothetical protein
MTSSPHGLYVQGYTRATMGGTKGRKPARGSQSHKTALSSDCSLQLDCMKLESLVIANQQVAVNMFPALVHTARHAMEVGSARRQWANLREAAGESEIDDWGEVVTR